MPAALAPTATSTPELEPPPALQPPLEPEPEAESEASDGDDDDDEEARDAGQHEEPQPEGLLQTEQDLGGSRFYSSFHVWRRALSKLRAKALSWLVT